MGENRKGRRKERGKGEVREGKCILQFAIGFSEAYSLKSVPKLSALNGFLFESIQN